MIKLIYGPEEYLNHLYINQIIKHHQLAKESIFTFDLKNDLLWEVLDKTKNDNLFNDQQLFIIKNIDLVFNKKGHDQTLMYLKKHLFFDKNNIVVLTSHVDTLNDQFEIIKTLKQEKNVTYNKKLSKKEKGALIKKAFANRGIEMNSDLFFTQAYLKTNGHLREMINEVNKLTLVKDEITNQDLESFIFESAKMDIFKLTNAIVEQKHENIMFAYQKITKKGINPLSVLALLSLNFSIINSVLLAKKNQLSSQEIAKKLKKPLFVVARCVRMLDQFKGQEITSIIDKLVALELNFKKGLVNNPDLIDLFLLSLIK